MKKRLDKRSFYNAANTVNAALYSWFVKDMAVNDILRSELPTIRARSRELTENDSWTSAGRRAFVVNIVGARGFEVRPMLSEDDFQNSSLPRFFPSAQDVNKFIKKEFSKWSKDCIVRGGTWRQAQKTVIESMYTDGEIFCRHYVDPDLNRWGYGIDFFESEFVDLDVKAPDQNVINGICFDSYGRPDYYVFYDSHPATTLFRANTTRKQINVPATDIIHLKNTTRPGQTRGIPQTTPVMNLLHQLHGYLDSTVVGKRVSAMKLGVIIPPKEDTDSVYENAERDDQGRIIDHLQEVGMELLPPGADLKTFNPTDDGGSSKEFVAIMGKLVASGLGVDVHDLTSDYVNVSYSSIRQANLHIKEVWKWRQDYIKETLVEPVFNKWLEISQLNGAFDGKISASDLDVIQDSISFVGRGWGFTDPTKEANSHKTYVEIGARSISDVIRENNQNPDDVFQEICDERAKLRELGIETIVTPTQEVVPDQNIEDDPILPQREEDH